MVRRSPADDMLEIIKVIIVAIIGFIIIRALIQAISP